MLTADNLGNYERKGLRYPSDLTDEEWALVEPLLPPERKVRRAVLDGILYVLTSGCQWRMIPKDFPPRSTVHYYFVDWHSDGTLARIHRELYGKCRELAGRQPSPTLAIVDSHSVKGAEEWGNALIWLDMTRASKSSARNATRRPTTSA